MAISGFRNTGNFVANARPENWREGIMLLYPNGKAPLTALTSLLKSKSTDDPKFHWWEKPLQTRIVEVTTTLTNVATSLVCAGGGAKGFKAGDRLKSLKTGEIVRVSADPASDTALTISRAQSGTTATAVTVGTDNPIFLGIGSAYEEGSAAPSGVAFDPTEYYNLTQIFRNSVESTRTAQKTRLRTGDDFKEAKREAMELHSIDIERALWDGVRYADTLNGKPLNTTGGIVSFIHADNKKVAATGGTDMEQLEEWMKSAFDFGSDTKMGFLGNRALLTIQQIIRKNSQFQLTPIVKEYGMNVQRLTCPFGELVLKTHPLWNQVVDKDIDSDGTFEAQGHESRLIILDQAELVWRPVDDTKYEKEIQDPGVDGKKDAWLTEAGLEVHHGKAHFMIERLNKALADT